MRLQLLGIATVLLGLIPFGSSGTVSSETAEAAAANASQILSQLPGCSIVCLSQALPLSGCSFSDINCMCNSDVLWDYAGECSLKACSTRDAMDSLKLTKQSCGMPKRNQSWVLVIVTSILFGLALAFVVVRAMARSPNRFELLGADDIIIFLAFLTGVPVFIFDFLFAQKGLGQDIWDLPFDNVSEVLFYFYLCEVPYLLSTVLMKMSILAFYLRVFVDYKFRRIVFGVAGVLVAFTVAYLFTLIFQCTPVKHAWEGWQKESKGTCINQQVGIWIHAALNIFFDLVVLFLPIPILLNLQFTYSIRAKLQILAMFSVGIIVTVVSILRLRALIVIKGTTNPTWDYFGAGLWSIIEIQVGVICASLPTARVFVSRVLPRWIGLRSNISSGATPIPKAGTKRSEKKISKYPLSWVYQSHSGDRSSHRIPSGIIETSTEFGTAEFLKLEDTPESTNREHLFRPKI